MFTFTLAKFIISYFNEVTWERHLFYMVVKIPLRTKRNQIPSRAYARTYIIYIGMYTYYPRTLTYQVVSNWFTNLF